MIEIVLAAALTVPVPFQCWPMADAMKALKDRYEEVLWREGEDATGKFQIWINHEKQTSTYVTFPVPGMACFLAGKNVIIPKANDA